MKLPEELQFMVNARVAQKMTTTRLDGQLVVITGATSGVGLAAARCIARGGGNLVLVCRNPGKAEQLAIEIRQDYSVQVAVVLADFSDLDQVRRAAAEILEDHSGINILINNAGLHCTARTLTKAGHETVFCVNHLASFLFTRLLLDRLKACAPSRILQINSEGHRFGGLDLDDLTWERRRYRGLQGYGASKTAQLLTVWELADRLAESGVTINAMHPGAVATNIGMNNGWLYRGYQKYLLFPFLKGPEISGEAIYYLVAAPEMTGISGKFFNQTIEEIPAAHARDRELGKRVWTVSEALAGIPGTAHAE
ncbi:MAG: SDR family NAD(P)-dependent oxidoreductase [Anaerolineales bacterium]|nr:SDR family NAD(P)-dependent oxidoreductase [Anaerolineales bacterium]